MLKKILSISGKSGLYKLISQGRNMLIIESLKDKRRMPAYAHEKILSLGDIAMYTSEGEVPLNDVMKSIKEKEGGKVIEIDLKKADAKILSDYMAEILPNYDKERVYVSDMKKLFSWYNLLIETGNDNFENEEK
ncbi:MAG: DUF5606 domain-containing protein [Paludibacteraceae bacterium]|mgnify:FL=1|jgi:predicted RNA-binding protein|nr:DUF5606 domain-containing protein [Paludibacteraceae bacterium]MEE0911859.1 DUF5606 domain-containing protein [Paludibacteraceae bacterium]